MSFSSCTIACRTPLAKIPARPELGSSIRFGRSKHFNPVMIVPGRASGKNGLLWKYHSGQCFPISGDIVFINLPDLQTAKRHNLVIPWSKPEWFLFHGLIKSNSERT